MRGHIQQGEPVLNYTHSVIEAAPLSGESVLLSAEEQWYIERKLYDGYFAFEALTNRDWNQAVCGICGIAPVFESGDGNAKNCTPPEERVGVFILDDNIHFYLIHLYNFTDQLYDGYFAFEALTNHDWNQAVCGICGIAPVFESGDGNTKNCTHLNFLMMSYEQF